MMKWGRKKPSSSPPSRLPSLSHAFPISWFSKFKQKSGTSEAEQTKVKPKGKQNLPPRHGSCKDGRFYGGDDDAYWRISFGEGSVDGRKSEGVLQSVWYDSDDEVEILPSSCRSCISAASKVSGGEETRKFSDMVSGMGKMRDLPGNMEDLPKFGTCRGQKESKETEFKTVRREAAKDWKFRKTNRKILEEKWLELGRKSEEAEEISPKTEERDIMELKPLQTIRTTERDYSKSKASGSRKNRYVSSMNSRNSYLRTIDEERVFAALNLEETDGVSVEELSSERQKLKDMKIKEFLLKGEKQRKSLYIRRESQRRRPKQNNKVRVHSPRTPSKVEVCKIKALEDLKKAKRKMKMAKEKTMEGRSTLEGFAVVKCSFDPEQDFRDSMVEMIMEKRIRRPEELEELLASYLTLNSDEYHDLIIEVFRQVWLDLNQPCFDPELRNEHCCYG